MTFEEWWEQNKDSYASLKNDMRDAWEAAWDQQQRVIDEMHLMFKDCVLVPKKPTEKMIDAGGEAYVHGGTIECVYKAMIQAAQESD